MVLSNRGSPQLYWCQGQPGIVVMIQFIASVRDSMQGVQFESSEQLYIQQAMDSTISTYSTTTWCNAE